MQSVRSAPARDIDAAIEAPSPSGRTAARRRGTVAISAALVVSSCFVGFALLKEPLRSPARPPDLRKGLMPPEFSSEFPSKLSCIGENCRRNEERRHLASPAKPV